MGYLVLPLIKLKQAVGSVKLDSISELAKLNIISSHLRVAYCKRDKYSPFLMNNKLGMLIASAGKTGRDESLFPLILLSVIVLKKGIKVNLHQSQVFTTTAGSTSSPGTMMYLSVGLWDSVICEQQHKTDMLTFHKIFVWSSLSPMSH